jgi:hypothetical protein
MYRLDYIADAKNLTSQYNIAHIQSIPMDKTGHYYCPVQPQNHHADYWHKSL